MQVKGKVPPANVQKAAQQLSQGKASLALELVGYDTSLTAAMQYAFGGSYVCQVNAKPCQEQNLSLVPSSSALPKLFI